MSPDARRLLNTLRCPICGAQIDLIEWHAVTRSGFNFGCVADPEHYSIYFIHWEVPLLIQKEYVSIYDGNTKYTILQDYSHNRPPQTTIRLYQVDPEKRIIEGKRHKAAIFPNITLFKFNQTTSEKLLNRIKTILVFQ